MINVKDILPHRDPILLVKTIIDYNLTKKSEWITCAKQITGKEDVFKGHFPNNPVWPGVYIVEGCAQSAGILLHFIARQYQAEIKNLGYFTGIDKTRFSAIVRPGDKLIYNVKFLHQKRNFYSFSATVHVKDTRVARTQIKITIP